MNERNQEPHLKHAFTIIELLVVIGILCLLVCFMLPVFARDKIKSPDARCLSNLRQMQLGASMYRDDNNDFLMPNAPGGEIGWVQKTEDWHNALANTNVAFYANSLLWPYINGDISVYRCPADFKPSDNGYRIRSYSMNGQMGLPPTDQTASLNPGWKIFQKGSDLTCPTPVNAFVLCDESMYTLNDGYLQMHLNAPEFPNVPAAYHAGGCGFSFADGHAEIHRWQGPNVVAVSYAYGVVGGDIPSSVQDPDWHWLFQRATCNHP